MCQALKSDYDHELPGPSNNVESGSSRKEVLVSLCGLFIILELIVQFWNTHTNSRKVNIMLAISNSYSSLWTPICKTPSTIHHNLERFLISTKTPSFTPIKPAGIYVYICIYIYMKRRRAGHEGRRAGAIKASLYQPRCQQTIPYVNFHQYIFILQLHC